MSYQNQQYQQTQHPHSSSRRSGRGGSGGGGGGSYFPEYPPDSRNQFPSSNPPPTYYHGGDYSDPYPVRYQGGYGHNAHWTDPSRRDYDMAEYSEYPQATSQAYRYPPPPPHHHPSMARQQPPRHQQQRPSSDYYSLDPHQTSAAPPLVYEVRFKCTKDSYRLDPNCQQEVQVTDIVIVETDRGYDAGQVTTISPADIPMASMYTNTYTTLRCIISIASNEDLMKIEENRQEEERALQLCRHLTLMRHLPIVVAATEMQFDRRKLTIIFSADRRVDFRELVRDMFQMFKTRIWMQKVSPTEATALSILFPTSPLPPQGMNMIYPQTRSLVALPNLTAVQAVAAAAAAERGGGGGSSGERLGGTSMGSGEPLDAYPNYESSLEEPPPRRSQHHRPPHGRDPYHTPGTEEYQTYSPGGHPSSSSPPPPSSGGPSSPRKIDPYSSSETMAHSEYPGDRHSSSVAFSYHPHRQSPSFEHHLQPADASTASSAEHQHQERGEEGYGHY